MGNPPWGGFGFLQTPPGEGFEVFATPPWGGGLGFWKPPLGGGWGSEVFANPPWGGFGLPPGDSSSPWGPEQERSRIGKSRQKPDDASNRQKPDRANSKSESRIGIPESSRFEIGIAEIDSIRTGGIGMTPEQVGKSSQVTPLARGRAHIGREGKKQVTVQAGSGGRAHSQRSKKSSVISAQAAWSCAASCHGPM